MSSQPASLEPIPDSQAGARSVAPISAASAIAWAIEDSLRLLFQPFDLWLWARLSLLCLFLGGGTPTAAFQWSLSALPTDLRLADLVGRVPQFVGRHPSLILLAVVLTLGLGLCFLYVRSIFRFILVDSLVRMKLALRSGWSSFQPLGKSYFWWLVGTLAGLGATFCLIIVVAYPSLRVASESGTGKLFVTALLALILCLIVVVGLVVALLIMLTDDLVVPLMYADRLPLPSAWRELWRKMRNDPASFAVYILLRFLLSVGVSVAVILFLVPLLVGVLSGAIILAALAALALHAIGFTWVWNLPTIALAGVAVAFLCALLAIILSAAGMPGQVFLQDFSLRFIAARTPSLAAMCSMSGGQEKPE